MRLSTTALVRLLIVAGIAAIWIAALRGRGGSVPLALIATFVLVVVGVAHARWVTAHACRVIRTHPFPTFLRDKVRAAHPQLDDAALRDVERGLRQFFLACAQAGGRFVAMPSRVVDSLWHEFILHTRGYEAFCLKAYGRMLHHTPAEALPSEPGGSRKTRQFAGLRRAWYWSCKEEAIDPRKPSRLPLLFALDSSLAIAGGYVYVPDCTLLGADRGGTHCGESFGCGSSCGSGGSDGSGDGGSDGGGDGGGGDGGGSGCGGD
ncbi:MAG TPA: hypothetical protein VJO99_04115 [Burkholderiaceae bacterium]|nr:hypothetical protein [Burkholderiaceae bacterium]